MKAPNIADGFTQRFQHVRIDARSDTPQFLLANAKLKRLHNAAVELRGVIDQRRITPPANVVNDRSDLVHQIGVEGYVALTNAP